MDAWRMADVSKASHQCQYCEKFVFTAGDSVSIPYEDAEQAQQAECKFFLLIVEKCPVDDAVSLLECPTLELFCDVGMEISAKWMFPGHSAYTGDSSVTIPIFAPPPEDSSDSRVSSPLNLTPGSYESFSTIRRWLHRCESERHPCCKNSRNWQSPTRLVDVGNKDSKDIRIYITDPERPVKYAALSYCWGGDQKSKTVCGTLEKRCRGFPLAELPETIRHAIFTARRLEIPYLWVDALCIVQDHDADKQRELPIMDQIYAGAFLTISAARAGRANYGFLQPRNLKQCYGTLCRVRYRKSVEGEKLLGYIAGNPLHIAFDDPIDSRGWTFQERVRSFRTLRFGVRQTVWQCSQGEKVDGGQDYVERFAWSTEEFNPSKFTGAPTDGSYLYSHSDPNYKYQLNEAWETWQTMVQEYSPRTLTDRIDRLPAFAAIAEAFGSYLGLGPEQYYAGLWAPDICMQLRWRRPSYARKDWQCKERHGPTWSWASLDGAVKFNDQRLPMGTDTLELVHDECHMTWKSPNFKYGQVESGKLKVRGFLRRLRLTDGKFIDWHHGGQCDVLVPLEAHFDCNEERGPELWCLEINTYAIRDAADSVGILLAKTGDNVYKRVGYFEFDHTKLIPEPILEGLHKPDLPPNSNWFYNGGFHGIYIE